ncbi:hypothetical protein [Methylobacterium soli]|uniref:Uncharacterized protein n=1 Tax=Methylobacterium soli TaxID=553447 RepID=A0A6L3SSU1_9HYPH|nr:hypothetical protein [Methylobacterium soli]KAB1076518.1 hypothetical protein F6X53_22700 [Methylobacterium soli]GJE44845.1 hypothetical protein AEGHOMDF_4036 [Methylobacterium soli]
MIWDLLTAWSFVRDYWPWVLGGSLAFIAVVSLAYFLRSWKLLLEALAGLAVGVSAFSIYRKGSRAELARRRADEARAIERTRAAQAEVDRMSDPEVNRQLDRWIPKP